MRKPPNDDDDDDDDDADDDDNKNAQKQRTSVAIVKVLIVIFCFGLGGTSFLRQTQLVFPPFFSTPLRPMTKQLKPRPQDVECQRLPSCNQTWQRTTPHV